MTSFSFETAPKIICQQGGALQLGEIARALGMHRVLVISDRGVLNAGLLSESLAALTSLGLTVTVFADVIADPPEESILAAVASAVAADIDGVIGIGGGSSLDTAKLVALLARTPQAPADIYGINMARGQRWPLIQVPTTAGTGSEVTPIAILTTPTQEKKGVVSPLLYPDVALLDATLTLGLPPAVTAMTGIDAMVHAIEAYTSRLKKNPLSDALAVKALALLYTNLPKVMANGKDVAAREQMLSGALLAGMAFANAPVAAVHALAYPLGGQFHVPHGLSNSLVLAPVLRFNLPAATHAYAQLARVILPGHAGPEDGSAAESFIKAIESMVRNMPYAQRLREVGVTEADLRALASDAMKVQRLLVNNPRELEHDDALTIYQSVF